MCDGGLEGQEAGSKREDQELTWETHKGAKWGLRLVNFLIAVFGVVLLVFCGQMISEESASPASLNPLIVVGAASLFIGMFGILATVKRKIMALYWLNLFFGTVLAVWMLAYATLNFSKIEDKVRSHFEENWGELVVSLPEEVLDKIPRSCGGNKVNLCDFSVDGAETPGFANATTPTDEEIDACTATMFEAEEEGDDDVICVYEPPCGSPSMCVGEYVNSTGHESNCKQSDHAPPVCAGTVASTDEDCGDLYEFMCNMVEDNCPENDGCVFTPANEDCPDECTYYPSEAGEALCVAETVESGADGGRRLQDDATEPEAEIVLGSSEDFEAQCWNTIKDSIMDNMSVVGYFLLFIVLLEVLCMYWCISVLTVGTAIGVVRKAVDVGMTIVGGLLFLTGVIMASELSSETMHLTVPCILLGGLMLVLGLFFGCCSKGYPRCAQWAAFIYVFLFIVMIVIAFGCIAYEDTVRETVAEKGDQWLDEFCDAECYADIQAKMASSRDADAQCNLPPDGEEECEADYDWTADRSLDPACNSTLPNTISQLCECPCAVAEAAAQVKAATQESIIKNIISGINTLGWVCILISIYMLIEVLCHLYNNFVADDINAEHPEATAPRGI